MGGHSAQTYSAEAGEWVFAAVRLESEACCAGRPFRRAAVVGVFVVLTNRLAWVEREGCGDMALSSPSWTHLHIRSVRFHHRATRPPSRARQSTRSSPVGRRVRCMASAQQHSQPCRLPSKYWSRRSSPARTVRGRDCELASSMETVWREEEGGRGEAVNKHITSSCVDRQATSVPPQAVTFRLSRSDKSTSFRGNHVLSVPPGGHQRACDELRQASTVCAFAIPLNTVLQPGGGGEGGEGMKATGSAATNQKAPEKKAIEATDASITPSSGVTLEPLAPLIAAFSSCISGRLPPRAHLPILRSGDGVDFSPVEIWPISKGGALKMRGRKCGCVRVASRPCFPISRRRAPTVHSRAITREGWMQTGTVHSHHKTAATN